MLKRLLPTAALAVGFASPALAQQQWPGVMLYDLRGQPLGTSANPLYVTGGTGGGGGGGATGSVTAAGTSGTLAQAVQGITGGVPQNGFTGQYNSTLPTFSNAQVGYVALDSNGRQILSPSSSVLADIRVGGNAVTTGNPVPVNIVSGGSAGSAGSVTAAGTNGTQAQAVQGITNGIPQNSFPAQYNSTLPTFASGAPGYLAVDSNGRLIQSPGASVTVSNTVAVTQSTSPWVVSNGGTFSVQNTAAVVGGNAVAVKTDGSATTQPVSATALPLPTGAATSANQTSEITQLTAANQRATYSPDFASFSVAASATVVGTTRSLGASPSPYSWISFNGSATVTGGTFYLQCATASDFSAGVATVATVAVTTASAAPGSGTTVPVSMADRVRYPFCRTVYQNGATAGAISGSTSLTVN